MNNIHTCRGFTVTILLAQLYNSVCHPSAQATVAEAATSFQLHSPKPQQEFPFFLSADSFSVGGGT